MTNKEAIEIISRYEVNGCGYCYQGGDEIPEAFNMAINALKVQEPRVMIDKELMDRIRKAPIVQIPDVNAVPVIRCRDCKYFEVKDHLVDFWGKASALLNDIPTCHMWGDGECKTSPDGYCFLGEWRDDIVEKLGIEPKEVNGGT